MSQDQSLTMRIGQPVEIWCSMHHSKEDGDCMFLFSTKEDACDYLNYAAVQTGFVAGGVWRLERDMKPFLEIKGRTDPPSLSD